MILCKHAFGKRSGGTNANNGYALEHDMTSKYYGMWVHADPKCRKPHHPHVNGIQIPLLSAVDEYKKHVVQ